MRKTNARGEKNGGECLRKTVAKKITSSTQWHVTLTWQASSINELAEEVLAATSLLPLETLLVTR